MRDRIFDWVIAGTTISAKSQPGSEHPYALLHVCRQINKEFAERRKQDEVLTVHLDPKFGLHQDRDLTYYQDHRCHVGEQYDGPVKRLKSAERVSIQSDVVAKGCSH